MRTCVGRSWAVAYRGRANATNHHAAKFRATDNASTPEKDVRSDWLTASEGFGSRPGIYAAVIRAGNQCFLQLLSIKKSQAFILYVYVQKAVSAHCLINIPAKARGLKNGTCHL